MSDDAVDPASLPRDVNIHFQLSMLTLIDTSIMNWHAQVFVRGSWIVDLDKPDKMTALCAKDSADGQGVKESEYDQLQAWGRKHNPSFLTQKKCLKKSSDKNDAIQEFLDIFDPQFYVVNLVGNRNESVQEYVAEFFPLGERKVMCLFSQRILGHFATEMNLRQFPWDNTALEMELMTQWDNTKVNLKDQQTIDPKRKHLLSATAQKYKPVEWELYDHGLNMGGNEEGGKKFGYDKVFITVYVRRNAGFYITKVYFPNFILCSTSVLSIFATQMGEQLGLVLTILLTGSAYQIVVSDAAPKGLPYNTNADWYLVACLIWNVIIMVICCTGIPWANYAPLWELNSDDLDDAYRFEHPEPLRNLVLILMGIWWVFNLFWGIISFVISRKKLRSKWKYKEVMRSQSQLLKDAEHETRKSKSLSRT